jgi:hypothetical protein
MDQHPVGRDALKRSEAAYGRSRMFDDDGLLTGVMG